VVKTENTTEKARETVIAIKRKVRPFLNRRCNLKRSKKKKRAEAETAGGRCSFEKLNPGCCACPCRKSMKKGRGAAREKKYGKGSGVPKGTVRKGSGGPRTHYLK